MPIESISLFPNPNTPDLGCFIRRKHEIEIDQDFENIHVELNPSIDFNSRYHQLYFRVMCGKAAFFQRCFVYMTSDLSIPAPILINFPPDWVLGGDYTPRPSEWYRYPTQGGQRFYWFFGQHRNPAGGQWRADAIVGHSYDIYENGTLSRIYYDDTGGDRDMNDLILEAAVVGRQSWRELIQAKNQKAINKQFTRKALPKIKSLTKKLKVKKR